MKRSNSWFLCSVIEEKGNRVCVEWRFVVAIYPNSKNEQTNYETFFIPSFHFQNTTFYSSYISRLLMSHGTTPTLLIRVLHIHTLKNRVQWSYNRNFTLMMPAYIIY